MAPYQFKMELGVIDKSGEERPPNADEREKLHGFKPGHTQGFFIALQLRTFCPNMRIIAGIFHVSLSSRNSGKEPGIRLGLIERDHGRRRYAVFHVRSIIATSVREQGIALKSRVTMDHMSVPCSEVCQRIRVKKSVVR